ncbi:MAG: MotA/TolQ/ExbB proton channel family protein, partial [Sedimentisphaerales bacterium]|nr:MotA/TolQ/ExbB proton channel family protein [Sedimentisphaerales bacterium]
LGLAGKEALLEAKRAERAELRQEQRQADRQKSDTQLMLVDAARKLGDLVETLPISETRGQQQKLLRRIKMELENSSDKAGGAGQVEALLELVEMLWRESQGAAVFEGEIRDGDGYERAVDILRVGQVFFAYRDRAAGQVGLAVAAPENQQGYRWQSDVSQVMAEQIDLAMTAGRISGVGSGGDSKGGAIVGAKRVAVGEFELPFDVTQQMAAEQSYGSAKLLEMMVSGGPVMIPLLAIVLLAGVLIFERLIFLSRQSHGCCGAAEAMIEACSKGEFERADELGRKSSTVVTRILRACLSRRGAGTSAMEDAIQEAILHEVPRLERFLSGIAILAGVAPLLGLLGTVTGMINTFNAITVFGSGQPRLMAGGISEALVTTAAGLVIAIPILLVHGWLSGRAERLVADSERYAATMLNLLGTEQGGKS